MFFLIWNEWHASAYGTAHRNICCQHCGCDFSYQEECEGQGAGVSWFFLFEDSAKLKAQSRAAAALADELENEPIPFPCPACGKYQQDMVRVLRRQTYLRLSDWGDILYFVTIVGVIAAVVGVGRLVNQTEAAPDSIQMYITIVVSGTLAALVWPFALVVRAFLRKMHDPHEDWPEHMRIAYARKHVDLWCPVDEDDNDE